jgi:hypothetical protein
LNAQERLIHTRIRSSKALKLLQPAQELLNNNHFWLHQSNGLAIFGSTEIFRYYHLPLDFPELVIVGNRFHIKPLLPLLISNGQFYVLALEPMFQQEQQDAIERSARIGRYRTHI